MNVLQDQHNPYLPATQAQDFHNTELGLLPKGWDVVRLGDIGEVLAGLTYSPMNVKENGTLVLRSSNVQENKLAFDNNVYVQMELPERVIVKENDILICVRNGSKQLIGKCALITKEAEGFAFGAFMSLYRSIYANFIFYQFQSLFIQRQINEILGATINQITNKDLNSFKIPFPPPEEQTRIAEILQDQDALIGRQEETIAKQKMLKQATMQALLQPKEGWEVRKLGEVFNFKQGIQCAVEKQKQTNNEGLTRFIRIIDLTQTNELPRYIEDPGFIHHIKKDDLFMVRYGSPGLLGFGYEGVIANNLFRLIPKRKLFAKFFYHLLGFKDDKIKQLTSSTTMPALNFTALQDLIICFPDFEEQTRIAAILSDMDAEIAAMEAELQKQKAIKEGLMQELLTGKRRTI